MQENSEKQIFWKNNESLEKYSPLTEKTVKEQFSESIFYKQDENVFQEVKGFKENKEYFIIKKCKIGEAKMMKTIEMYYIIDGAIFPANNAKSILEKDLMQMNYQQKNCSEQLMKIVNIKNLDFEWNFEEPDEESKIASIIALKKEK